MGSGSFPLSGKEAERLIEAARLITEVCDEYRDDVYSGESGGGQYDNAASDGASLAMLRLAAWLVKRCSSPLGYDEGSVKALVRAARVWRQDARSILAIFDAYDGQGIPQRDARNSYALLRAIGDTSGLAPFAGIWEEEP